MPTAPHVTRTWYVSWPDTDPDDTERTRSVTTTDEQEARQWAEETSTEVGYATVGCAGERVATYVNGREVTP